MTEEKKTVYIRAWLPEGSDDDLEDVKFNVTLFRSLDRMNTIEAGVVRGNVTVIVSTSWLDPSGILPKSVLRDVAKCYLDGNYRVISYDLGER